MKSALRLRRATDFIRARRQGTQYRYTFLVLSYVENDLPYNRYGIVTSKKLGNAVVRNLIKRRLREAIYRLHPRLYQGYDIIVIARPVVVGQPFSQLLRILDKLCEQAGLMRGK
jgi:ribonuclease P protein component